MTVETWVRFEGFNDKAGPISFGQDDGPNTHGPNQAGVFLAQRYDPTDGDPDHTYLTFALASEQGQQMVDGHLKGQLTYLGYDLGPDCDRPTPGLCGKQEAAKVGLGEWVHWAGTYNGMAMKLYVNGNLVATDSSSQQGDILFPLGPYIQQMNQIHGGWFTLGAYHDASSYAVLNGAMDDLRIWSVALPATSFSGADRATGLTCQDPSVDDQAGSLMHYFKFDELAGGSTVASQVRRDARAVYPRYYSVDPLQ